jgi:CRISPR-associated protein Cas1
MFELLNTLYVLTQGAHLHLDHDTVRVSVEGEPHARFPLTRLSAIVVLGNVTVSPFLILRCGEDGRSIAWLTRSGRFRARLDPPVNGNVLLRRAQHLALSDSERTAAIARQFIAGKVQNSRLILLRAARENRGSQRYEPLRAAAAHLAGVLVRLKEASDLDPLRGLEGEAAREYFGVFGHMVRAGPAFEPAGRTRRPPRDRANALLSFLYGLLRNECASALEAAGLDPQVGYLHGLRPGRPALALDLMEELRPLFADRLALALINRRMLDDGDFEQSPGGAVILTEVGRRAVIAAYQIRKAIEVEHPLLKQRLQLGLLPFIQARLLARHLRGDLPHYPPFIGR